MRVKLNGFFVRFDGLLPIIRLCICHPNIVVYDGIAVTESQCGAEFGQRLVVSPKLGQGDAVLGASLSKVRALARNPGELRLGFLGAPLAPVDPRLLPPGQIVVWVEAEGDAESIASLPVVSRSEERRVG